MYKPTVLITLLRPSLGAFFPTASRSCCDVLSVTSKNASFNDSGSTSGMYCSKMPWICFDTWA